MSVCMYPTDTHNYWHIGMSDIVTEGSWIWLNGQAVTTTRVNFDNGNTGADQNCGGLHIDTERLVDLTCTTPRRRICQMSL